MKYKVFHRPCEYLLEAVHVILVRPEFPANFGSVARVSANMGIQTPLRVFGTSSILTPEAFKLAKHAREKLTEAAFFSDYSQAVSVGPKPLRIAITARTGSANRPHPLRIDVAVGRALRALQLGDFSDVALVFGPESDGLTNAEIEGCEWLATIPSSDGYRSLNLSHAVMVGCYEVHRQITEGWAAKNPLGPSQKERLVAHFIRLAKAVGFILPGDPYKMQPRLEHILSTLPPHLEGVKTLHGLLDQL